MSIALSTCCLKRFSHIFLHNTFCNIVPFPRHAPPSSCNLAVNSFSDFYGIEPQVGEIKDALEDLYWPVGAILDRLIWKLDIERIDMAWKTDLEISTLAERFLTRIEPFSYDSLRQTTTELADLKVNLRLWL